MHALVNKIASVLYLAFEMLNLIKQTLKPSFEKQCLIKQTFLKFCPMATRAQMQQKNLFLHFSFYYDICFNISSSLIKFLFYLLTKNNKTKVARGKPVKSHFFNFRLSLSNIV